MKGPTDSPETLVYHWDSRLEWNIVQRELLMEYRNIRLSIDPPFATLTLDRPKALNSLSPHMLREMVHAIQQLEMTPGLKALTVRGNGRAFCTGADLDLIAGSLDSPARIKDYLTVLNGIIFKLEELPFPVIGVVHGYVLAGGLELMLGCDMVIAAEDARIGDQHANFGLMPGGGSTQRLPGRIGRQRAMELLFTGRWISGRKAQEWGLVLRAAPQEQLDHELENLLDQLRPKSDQGLARIKDMVLRGRELPLRAGVAQEVESFVEYTTTSPHPREGIAAFKDKRQPIF